MTMDIKQEVRNMDCPADWTWGRPDSTGANSHCPDPSGSLFDLIEQWERRAKAADKSASDADEAGDFTTSFRRKTKAEVIRSMAAELKRELNLENSVMCVVEQRISRNQQRISRVEGGGDWRGLNSCLNVSGLTKSFKIRQ